MKAIFTFCITLIILLTATGSLTAQTAKPKPQYLIHTVREGTPLGDFRIELFPYIAPKHVANFDSLVNLNFYDSTAFHRVIPGFMIQGGDPNSKHGPRSTWGYGDPSQETVEAEFSKIAYLRGIVGAARSADTNSATSQFFICVAASRHLDGQYTAYGRVIEGMNIADSIVNSPRDANDNPYKKIEMFITRTGYNDSLPDAPALNQPADSLGEVTGNRVLSWKTVNGAVLYRVEVSTFSDFSKLFAAATVGTTQYTAKSLEKGKRYYWRVKANNGGGEGVFSSVRTFTTQDYTGITVPEQTSFTVSTNYPNPFMGETTFSIYTEEPDNIVFYLKDLFGRTIRQEVITVTKPGIFSYALQANKIAPGSYHCLFVQGSGQKVVKCMRIE